MLRIFLIIVALCVTPPLIWFLVSISRIGGGVEDCMKLEDFERDKCMAEVNAKARPAGVMGKAVSGQN
ncbi:hypothetical protein [Pseudomonas lurida]|uniref:hypothetical protein n=1 Tax=Pseudomonas lurida TaxID=244566 RepID=UPI0030D9D071